MKKIKKVISMLLILTLIGVNFMPLLNVRAEGEVTISVNEGVSKEGDINSKYVTNTTSLTVSDVNENDTFSAYKILDVYYNKNANQFWYAFTSDFANFKNDSNYSSYVTANGKTIGELTIDDYFNLTSDSGSNASDTTSTLNQLVSKYATYIRKNNVTNINMTTKTEDDFRADYSHVEEVTVGAYLILPDSVTSYDEQSEAFTWKNANTYGVMVANIVFTSDNGVWELEPCRINSKHITTDLLTALIDASPDHLMEVLANGDISFDDEINFVSGMEYSYLVAYDQASSDIPANTHSSIKDNPDIKKLIGQTTIHFPEGVSYNKDQIYLMGADIIPVNIREDGVAYITYHDNTKELADITFQGQDVVISNLRGFEFLLCAVHGIYLVGESPIHT